jgi:hypothetical protein
MRPGISAGGTMRVLVISLALFFDFRQWVSRHCQCHGYAWLFTLPASAVVGALTALIIRPGMAGVVIDAVLGCLAVAKCPGRTNPG